MDVHGYLWVSELCKKPLRGKLPKAEFPTALGNPHTPRIPTFRQLRLRLLNFENQPRKKNS